MTITVFTDRTAGREQVTDIRKDNKLTYTSDTFVANPILTALGLSQKKDKVLACQVVKESKLKYVKDVFCVNQLSFVKPVTNVQHAVSNLLLWARLQNF